MVQLDKMRFCKPKTSTRTKLDGSSKGGVVLAIRNEMNLPVKLVGLGERAEDLADFDAANYAIGLFHGLV